MGMSIMDVLNGAGVKVKNDVAVLDALEGVIGGLYRVAAALNVTSEDVADGFVLDCLDEVARTGNPPTAFDALDPLTAMFAGMDVACGLDAASMAFDGVTDYQSAAETIAKAHRFAIDNR